MRAQTQSLITLQSPRRKFNRPTPQSRRVQRNLYYTLVNGFEFIFSARLNARRKYQQRTRAVLDGQ